MMRQYELVERVQAYNPHTDEALLNKAYVYAMQKHGTQKRASGDPYFNHPLEVAAILTELKLDDASIAVALLHDTIEDTDATRAEIDQLFGAEIGAIVDGLTKIERLQLVTREEAQAENLRKLLLAISADVRVLLVKLADRLHNMRTLDFMPEEKRKRIANETMDIYAPLAGRMGMQDMRSRTRGPCLQGAAARPLPGHHRPARRDAVGLRRDHRHHQPRARREAQGRGDRGQGQRAGEVAVVDLHQDRAQVDRPRAALRHDRLPRHRPLGGGLLPGAGHRPHQLEGRARAVQGLHLGPQAQRLPLDPHHHRRRRAAARRAADPHRGDAPDRRVRHRRARPLQGGRDRRPPQDREREQGLRLAARDHRAPDHRRLDRGFPRIHQARAVPGPGVLLHPARPADRAAARRHADRLRLCAAHRHRRHLRRRQDQRRHRAAGHPAALGRRSRDHPRPEPPAALATGRTSPPPARPGRPSAAPCARRRSSAPTRWASTSSSMVLEREGVSLDDAEGKAAGRERWARRASASCWSRWARARSAREALGTELAEVKGDQAPRRKKIDLPVADKAEGWFALRAHRHVPLPRAGRPARRRRGQGGAGAARFQHPRGSLARGRGAGRPAGGHHDARRTA